VNDEISANFADFSSCIAEIQRISLNSHHASLDFSEFRWIFIMRR